MSRKDYYAVGEIMTRKNGKKYEVIYPTFGCKCCIDCAFYKKDMNWCDEMKCSKLERKDNQDVIFHRRKDLEETK